MFQLIKLPLFPPDFSGFREHVYVREETRNPKRFNTCMKHISSVARVKLTPPPVLWLWPYSKSSIQPDCTILYRSVGRPIQKEQPRNHTLLQIHIGLWTASYHKLYGVSTFEKFINRACFLHRVTPLYRRWVLKSMRYPYRTHEHFLNTGVHKNVHWSYNAG